VIAPARSRRIGSRLPANLALCLIALGGCADTRAETDLVEVAGDTAEPEDLDTGPDASADSAVDSAAEVFVCRTDSDCVPVIGGVDICERAACNTLTGTCVRTAKVDGTPCSDRNACTASDTCRSARCVGLGTVDCDDQNPCTADSCDPRSGCVHTPTEGFCEDTDLCTERERCVEGRCSGAPVDCDDHDACTIDRCDPEAGCGHRAIDPCPGSPG
jgi:hypothetical protein